jgi:schlafen family protein
MATILDRALTVRRESRRVEFKGTLDLSSQQAWCEVIRDIVAMANSGGGVILFGVDRNGQPSGVVTALDPVQISDKLQQYVDSHFSNFELDEVSKGGVPVVALIVGEAVTPIVFTKPGLFATADGKQKVAFNPGTVYFRHGARSQPGTTEDLAAAINRRVETVRKSWLSAMRRVVTSPVGSAMGLLPAEVRDSDLPEATPIRVVDDPRAPAYRVVDYDKTHPFRQKELLNVLHAERPDVKVNQFDLRAVRAAYGIDSNADFSHMTLYGTRQYSSRFLKWLLEQMEVNPEFVADARKKFSRAMRRS